MARTRTADQPTAAPGPVVGVGLFCPMHRCALDETGWCAVAQAWWRPRFACPRCHGWLWDNGACESCTPKTGQFPGDYFEGRWGADAGREYGHYVRVHRGPTPLPTLDAVRGFFAELRALEHAIGQPITREPGDEPAWITEG